MAGLVHLLFSLPLNISRLIIIFLKDFQEYYFFIPLLYINHL